MNLDFKTTKNEQTNIFKFALYQDDVLFCEKIFDANQYNPFTRYSVNIRNVLPKAINKLQRVLSKKGYNTRYVVNGECVYDFFAHHCDEIKQYNSQKKQRIIYNPPSISQNIDGKVIKGVPFKIGLYINENTIVEREFYVDNFHPVSRWSADVVRLVVDIADEISEKIKQDDINNTWDDYTMINAGYSFAQIRQFSNAERNRALRNLTRK